MKRESKNTAVSEFGETALALDRELADYARLSTSVERLPMHSRKELEHLAKVVSLAGECRERIGERMAAFIRAMQEIQRQNEKQTEIVRQREEEIVRRATELEVLAARFAPLGIAAAEIVATTQAFGDEAADPQEAAGQLGHLEERLNSLTEEAKSLASDAAQAAATDLASEADALRQRLLSLRNKISIARRSISN